MVHVVVVGGGLAGLSAACRAISRGAFVTLIEKESLGGNSAKATSGINAVHSTYQNEMMRDGIVNDSVELFQQDTLKAGHYKNKVELTETLALLSGEAVDSLRTEFGLVLSDVQQLGGHSAKRTHRFPPIDGRVAPVGFTIMAAMRKRFSEYVEDGKAELLQKTVLEDFSIIEGGGEDGPRLGSIKLRNLNDNTTSILEDFASVVLAAGGYAADTSAESLLATYRPDLVGFPTTNGDFASGDAIKIGLKRGLAAINLEEVQLHPTGFVDPKDPHASRKFLCPEVMRGVGAILVDTKGRRFVDELLPRDKVASSILQHGGSTKAWKLSEKEDKQKIALMVLSEKMADSFGSAAFNFYVTKGFIFELSNSSLVDMRTVEETLASYDLASDGAQSDCCSKTVFPAKFDHVQGNKLFGAFVTPSLHFSMGGLEIDSNARAIVESTRKPVKNLYVAGETSGGVHGGNRLGGNGCLESLVFGRLAGLHASSDGST